MTGCNCMYGPLLLFVAIFGSNQSVSGFTEARDLFTTRESLSCCVRDLALCQVDRRSKQKGHLAKRSEQFSIGAVLSF